MLSTLLPSPALQNSIRELLFHQLTPLHFSRDCSKSLSNSFISLVIPLRVFFCLPPPVTFTACYLPPSPSLSLPAAGGSDTAAWRSFRCCSRCTSLVESRGSTDLYSSLQKP